MQGEPWCFHTSQVAVLTDSQILHGYVLPASEKAEEFERRRKGMPAKGEEVQRDPNYVPSKQYMVSVMVGLGMSPKAAEEEYAKQLAAHQKKQTLG
jgi:hypothetical protein